MVKRFHKDAIIILEFVSLQYGEISPTKLLRSGVIL